LTGSVNPTGRATRYRFEYGPTNAYGLQTQERSAGANSADVAVEVQLSNLQAATTFNYRLVATNTVGASVGADRSFRTLGGKPLLRARPSAVKRGQAITFSGTGFRPQLPVTLLIGPPRAHADRFANVRTNSAGAFNRRYRFSSRWVRGPYVVLACQLQCRVKARTSVRIR
jgi:hypothetical protein